MSINTKNFKHCTAVQLFSVLLLLFPMSSIANAANINDVPKTNFHYQIYQELVDQQAFSLTNDGRFRPTEAINKAAFLKASLSYLGYQPNYSLEYYTGYVDVPADSWFAPYVKTALNNQFINNYLGDKFNPEELLNRQQALLLTIKIYGIPVILESPTQENLFEDIRINHPLAGIYSAAKAAQIFFIDNENNFYPARTLTRGDAAELLYRAKHSKSYVKSDSPLVTISPVETINSDLTENEKNLLESNEFGIFLDSWNRIHENFLYQTNVTNNDLIYGAISGMVDSLDDPYSNFTTPDANGKSVIYIPEDYVGIGAVIEEIEGKYTIITALNNSPAAKAGLQTGDIILEVGGIKTETLDYSELLAKIKGEENTIVKLKIDRSGQILSFDIKREKISFDLIHYELLENRINYINIYQFGESTGREFVELLPTIEETGSKKLIIDLRNNPGGYLSSTREILNYFLNSKQIAFHTKNNSGAITPYFSEGDGRLQSYDTIVLVNGGSASASEIFAAALQDYQLATIVGSPSYGKGTVQEITDYSDNSSLKLTIAQWLSSKLRDLNHTGVTPDKVIEVTDFQREKNIDSQLNEAILLLK